MRRRKIMTILWSVCAVMVLSIAMPSCGTLHSHWGVEHEYEFSNGHHKPKKQKKPKKHKSKKHHKHHDDD